jgi:SAM-dependent methyltransferase
MAPEIALNAISERVSGAPLTVLDPMCGSGTVLAAALQRGHNAIGIDIDPLAVMMSRVTVSEQDFSGLSRLAREVAEQAKLSPVSFPWGADDKATADFVDFWFGPKQRDDLARLMNSIRSVESEEMRLALRLSASRLIVTKSPRASLAADTSHSRPHRVITASEFDVLEGFVASSIQLERMLLARVCRGVASVHGGDARSLLAVDDASIDLSVTSPPYLNALDYLRGHKLALVWFGYSVATLRELRRQSIGAERRPDEALKPAVESIVATIEREVADPSKLPLGTVQRFAGDMAGFAFELGRVLKPSADAVVVVGNSTLRGNYIRNDYITQLAMEQAGFTFVSRTEREIPPARRYMAISNASDSSISKRMRSEVVLTMRR